MFLRKRPRRWRRSRTGADTPPGRDAQGRALVRDQHAFDRLAVLEPEEVLLRPSGNMTRSAGNPKPGTTPRGYAELLRQVRHRREVVDMFLVDPAESCRARIAPSPRERNPPARGASSLQIGRIIGPFTTPQAARERPGNAPSAADRPSMQRLNERYAMASRCVEGRAGSHRFRRLDRIRIVVAAISIGFPGRRAAPD